MTRFVLGAVTGFALGLALLSSGAANAAATSTIPTAGDITLAIVEPSEAPLVLAATDGAVPLNQILELEPGHLLALGSGVVVGAVVIGPYLGASEIVGLVVGVIGAELFYRSELWPLEKPRSWLP